VSRWLPGLLEADRFACILADHERVRRAQQLPTEDRSDPATVPVGPDGVIMSPSRSRWPLASPDMGDHGGMGHCRGRVVDACKAGVGIVLSEPLPCVFSDRNLRSRWQASRSGPWIHRVEMPIGCPMQAAARLKCCVREMVGPRRASVFRTPVRPDRRRKTTPLTKR